MSAIFFPDLQEETEVVPNYSFLKVHGDFFVTEAPQMPEPTATHQSPSMGPTSSRSSDMAESEDAENSLPTATLHTAPSPVGDDDVEETYVRVDTVAHCLTEQRMPRESTTRTTTTKPKTTTARCYCHRLSPTDGCKGCSACCCCLCRSVQTPPPLFVALRMGTQSRIYLSSRFYTPLVLAPLTLH